MEWKNTRSSHWFPLQWQFFFFKGKKKKKSQPLLILTLPSWGINDCTLTSEHIFRWSSWRRYDFVLSYKSQLWQHNESINCNKLLYNKIPTALKDNSLHNRLTVNYLEEHTQDFPSLCPPVSPLALENLNRYIQFTIYHSAYLHPVVQKTCWQEDLVILVNWNTFCSVEACTDLTFYICILKSVYRMY